MIYNMKDNKKEGVDLGLRQFIKSLGYVAGGTALLATTPWLTSCTPEKLKEIKHEKARIALIGTGSRGQYHIHNLKEIPHAQIVAVCDNYAPNLQQALDLCPGAKSYTDYRKLLESKDIDGVIIEPSKSQISCRHLHLYERLEEYGIPYVFIQGCFDQMEDKPQVLMDDCRGGHLITKYLLDTGHRDIAGVFKADDIQGQNRHRGYVQALQEAGVLYDPDKVIWFHTEDRKVHPQEGIRRLISKGTRLDSVVCYNDQIAMQVIPTLTSRGIRVPEDISVTGYDNSYMAIGGGFQLTTIVHPQEKLGEMAAQLLLSLLHGESLGPEERKILIQPELVVGNTTC